MSVERSEGVLCLIGGATLEALDAEISRILTFIRHSTGIRLIDIVYTATCDARGCQCVAGLWVASLEEMERRLRFALNALRSGRTRLRDKSGVFFTTRPLALAGGKTAFIFPGTGSFHLEMMRDLALTFDGVRQRFDDMEEAFAGFCDVASPSEWLFSTAPEHTLRLSDSQRFLPLLASASTYLASKVFADFLRAVGVKPDAVGGVGLGSFSAFHATHHDPKLRLVQILRDAGRMLLRLAGDCATDLIQLTVTGCPTDLLLERAAHASAHLTVIQELAADECVLAVAPAMQAETEAFIRDNGGISIAEPLGVPVNTGINDPHMRRLFERFFAKWVTSEPQVPFYSCVTGRPMKQSTSSVVEGLTAQMHEPLHFRQMIEAMYNDGCRIFVEVGARGLLSPIISKILAGREDPVAVIPMHILHRSGGVQVGQAIGQLAANGIPVDYSELRFFAHAKRLDFSLPTAEDSSASLSLPLARELPMLRPELLDTHRPLTSEATPSAAREEETHSHVLPSTLRTNALAEPLLRSAIETERTDTHTALQVTLHLKDFPWLSDYAIGTTGVSLCNPQMRGLTLFSVAAEVELMAETAHRLLPGTVLRVVEHLRAPRWLSFAFGKLAVTVTADAAPPDSDGNRAVRVRICAEDRTDGICHPVADARLIMGTSVPQPPQPDPVVPLVSPKPIDWKPVDIYPARLFHGPQLRNVRRATGWGFNGIDYTICVPTRAAAVRGTRNPFFNALPMLLDAIVSGFPLWRSHERFHGAISLPFRCRAIRYYAAWVPEGTELRCYLRLANVTPRSFEVDIRVTDTAGHPILSCCGWEELSGRAERSLHDFVMNPSKYFISQPLPPALLPDADASILGAVYVNSNPDFFVSNQELWLSALSSAVLTESERENFADMGGSPHRRLEWLLGRTVAKESVRRLLLHNFNLYASSADIDIWKDALGKPHPLGDWQSKTSGTVDLSIAHTGGLILAAATTHGKIGFDVESVSRDLTEDFLRGVFTLEEQELAGKSGDGPTAILRFWCSKEAISKALGTGIRFAPTDLRIREADPATGELRMELLGAWAEHFPMFRGQRIKIKTAILFDHAIAACILPHFTPPTAGTPN